MTGHQEILEYFENCRRNNTLAHAYSLIGTATSGREKLLEVFLGSLLGAKTLDHPDIQKVSPEKGNISIEQIRDLKQWLSLSPLAGKQKAAIIASAESMNEASQNAFLKVLEEPVPNTYLFLLVGHKHLLLPTIFSRTAPLYFANPSPGAGEIALLQPYLASADASERLRLWLQNPVEKEEIKNWLVKIIPELRALLLQKPSLKLAKSIRALLEALSGPSGQNWNLIAENMIISL